MPEDRPVTEEALVGMIKALEEFITETNSVIQSLQADANTCADNMNGDMVSAKAIIRVNKCIARYRQINEKAVQLHQRMRNKLLELRNLQHIMDGME